MPKHTSASSWESTGGLTKCEVAAEPERGNLAARGNVPQSHDSRNLVGETRRSLAAPQVSGQRWKCHTQRWVAQKERAWMAWFCSNPQRDDRATGTPSNRSTASPVPASLPHHSRMHTPRERQPIPPVKLASPNASLTNLASQCTRVNQAAHLTVHRQIRDSWSAARK